MATVTHLLRPEHAQYDPNIAKPQLRRFNGTNFAFAALAYDAAADEKAHFFLKATRYGGGSLTIKIRWAAVSATTGNVVWSAAIGAITPNTDTGAVTAKGFATAQTFTDSHLGTTAGRLHEAEITISSPNLDSLADGDYIVLQIGRDGTSGSDTMAGDAVLIQAAAEWSDV